MTSDGSRLLLDSPAVSHSNTDPPPHPTDLSSDQASIHFQTVFPTFHHQTHCSRRAGIRTHDRHITILIIRVCVCSAQLLQSLTLIGVSPGQSLTSWRWWNNNSSLYWKPFVGVFVGSAVSLRWSACPGDSSACGTWRCPASRSVCRRSRRWSCSAPQTCVSSCASSATPAGDTGSRRFHTWPGGLWVIYIYGVNIFVVFFLTGALRWLTAAAFLPCASVCEPPDDSSSWMISHTSHRWNPSPLSLQHTSVSFEFQWLHHRSRAEFLQRHDLNT